jgi:hypothetical protein
MTDVATVPDGPATVEQLEVPRTMIAATEAYHPLPSKIDSGCGDDCCNGIAHHTANKAEPIASASCFGIIDDPGNP